MTSVPIRRGGGLYWRLARELRPYGLRLLGLLFLSMLATPLALLAPVPLKIVVDSVLGSRPLSPILKAILPTGSNTALLAGASLLFVSIALLTQVQSLVTAVCSAYVGERLLLDFRARLFRHLQRQSVSYHDLRGTSDSTYRVQYDATAMQQIVVDTIPSFFTAMFTVVSMLYVTAMIDWQLALVAIGICPILFVVSWRYRRRLREQSRHVKELESGAMSIVQQALVATRVVQAFGREDYEERRFIHGFREGMRARIRYVTASSGYAMIVAGSTAIGSALVLYLGARRVQARIITLGELTLVMSYLMQLYGPLKTMSKRAGLLQNYLASAERVFALLDEEPDVKERPNARPLRRARGDVVFDDVSFSYDGEHPVLRGVSIHVSPGASVGVAGATGAGKTTLVSLLNRFYDPTHGRIRLDGVDLRDYRIADLRAQFAIVLQEPLLFSSSIGENIGYARPDARADDIVSAAAAAGAHEFIRGLPDGYDTLVGERGVRLSGGERQRISLARAFLKDAPVLILDEPTSSVDLQTEAAILSAMYRLMDGRTTFMIAHRLSTLKQCDERLELSAGRVARVSGGLRRRSSSRSEGSRVAATSSSRAARAGSPARRAGRVGGRTSEDGTHGGPKHVDPREVAAYLIPTACRGATVRRVRESKAPRSTSYLLQRLTLDLADRRRLDVFVKNFDISPHESAVALARGARERYIYEKVLAGRNLGTPEFYGAVWGDSPSRHLLLLEFVEGRQLQWKPIDERVAAAGWLGRLQGTVAGQEAELARSGLLLSYDNAYFEDTAERALRAVGARFASLLRRLEAVLADYGAVVASICSAPSTLVHGSYRLINILVDTRPTPHRICPADWEHAAVGPRLHDLAFVANADGSATDRLCESYAEAAASAGLAVPGVAEMIEELSPLRLHRALRSLARSAEWAYSEDKVSELVARAETIRHAVG